jgi:hypothetical protein
MSEILIYLNGNLAFWLNYEKADYNSPVKNILVSK